MSTSKLKLFRHDIAATIKTFKHPRYEMPGRWAVSFDTEKAIQWYQEILGFQLLVGPLNLVADDSHFGQIVTDIWGSGLGGGRLAELTGGKGLLNNKLYKCNVVAYLTLRGATYNSSPGVPCVA